MCDYSLEATRQVQAEKGQEYTLTRLGSHGSKGFAPAGTCDTSACMSEGMKLELAGIGETLQSTYEIGPSEIVEFGKKEGVTYGYRDLVRFANGRELLLQTLNEGVTARIHVSLDERLGVDTLAQIKGDNVDVTETILAGVE